MFLCSRLFLSFVLFSSVFSYAEVLRQARNRQYYNDYSHSGFRQSGQADSSRRVYQYDGPYSTNVQESYIRDHRSNVTSGSSSSDSRFGNQGNAARTYLHNGDPEEVARMNAYEKNRLSMLAQVDALTTRLEKQKAFLVANVYHSREERRRFRLELDRIDYEIGEIAMKLGSRALRRANPDVPDDTRQKLDDIIDRLEWSGSEHFFNASNMKSYLHKIGWSARYLSELRTSLNTAFASYKPRDDRDRIAELDAIIKRLEAIKIK